MITGHTPSVFGGLALLLTTVLASSEPARAESTERTTLNVAVTDAEAGQPVYQAHLTLQFQESGNRMKLRRSKLISYSAKTNPQGRCRFPDIPKGTIHLIVIADHHQTFGKDFELERDNQLIEVKLKKPQPEL